jgi:hypothetical protein
LDVYLKLQPNDYVLVCYTADSRKQAAQVALELSQRGAPFKTVSMLPLVDDSLRNRVTRVLPDPSSFSGRFVLISLERSTMSHFDVFYPLFDKYGMARLATARIISASDEFFEYGLAIAPVELEQLNAALLTWFQGANSVHVSSLSGTELDIGLDHERYEWISNRGIWRPGGFTILPAGEIATYPAAIDGILAVDAVHANVITDLDTNAQDQPLKVVIEGGRARDVTGGPDELRVFVRRCLEMKNGTRVGELGFGTNLGIRRFTGWNSHLDERAPGLHVGLGQHNQGAVVDYYADIHMDLISVAARLSAPGRDPVDLGNLSGLTPAPHPPLTRDEDVTGDCCSSGCKILA